MRMIEDGFIQCTQARMHAHVYVCRQAKRNAHRKRGRIILRLVQPLVRCDTAGHSELSSDTNFTTVIYLHCGSFRDEEKEENDNRRKQYIIKIQYPIKKTNKQTKKKAKKDEKR